MNNAKVTVPPAVATAIAQYVNLADTKTEALTDILSLGYEAERSEIILRHFEGNHDELMQALICGYEVEKSPEDEVREMYKGIVNAPEIDEFNEGVRIGIIDTLNTLGIDIEGVNI